MDPQIILQAFHSLQEATLHGKLRYLCGKLKASLRTDTDGVTPSHSLYLLIYLFLLSLFNIIIILKK